MRAVDIVKTVVHYGWCVFAHYKAPRMLTLQGAVCDLRGLHEQLPAPEPAQVRGIISYLDCLLTRQNAEPALLSANILRGFALDSRTTACLGSCRASLGTLPRPAT